MIHNIERIGNFTSSEIVKLMSNGKKQGEYGQPFYTYIEEKNMERRLGRCLHDSVNGRPMIWGKFLEQRVFDKLGLDYSLISKETIIHPHIDCWSGSPDGTSSDAVIDIKCPMTHKSLCQLVDPLYRGLTGIMAMNFIRATHKEGDTYFYQLVSNAILTGKKYAELIVYMPYLSELDDIRKECEDYDGNPNDVAFIHFSTDDNLPYLNDKGYYRNVNVIRFEVPEDEKMLLTERVLAGQKLLQPINR